MMRIERYIDTHQRPLDQNELGVLRAQYEKEGHMVGVQTKFNYAWVRLIPAPCFGTVN